MKKSLITQFAMMMFMAFTLSFTLTSCGEEVDINGGGNPGKTVFSAGTSSFNNEDGTRTRLDKNFVFYWADNDQIWINDGGTWLKSSTSQLDPSNKSASFYYNKLLTANSYQVVYTGNNATSATEVTISANVSGVSSNNYGNIGVNGDCGTALAARAGGTGEYSFKLQHKASYLGIAPMKVSYLNRNYTWTKIEIADVNGKPIAGTFGFSYENGIDTTNVTSPSSTITITPGTNYTIPLQNYYIDYDYLFVTLPPCYRKLKVTYYFVDRANTADTMRVSTTMNPQKFFENNAMKVHYPITPNYYRWDAPVNTPEPFSTPNTGADYTKATNSCATMPNPNEMYWYVSGGDPRWDSETEWTDEGDITSPKATKYKGGVWIKKKQYITGFSSTVGMDGVDMRTTTKGYAVTSTTYKSGGKPANTSQYFFLTALGLYSHNASVVAKGTGGYYWSSYAAQYHTGLNMQAAYGLYFDSNSISINGSRRRTLGYIAGNGSDWFK